MEGLQELGMQPVPTTPTMESSPVRSSPDLQSMEFLHQVVQLPLNIHCWFLPERSVQRHPCSPLISPPHSIVPPPLSDGVGKCMQIVQRRAPPRSSLQPNPFQQGSRFGVISHRLHLKRDSFSTLPADLTLLLLCSGRIMSQFRFVAEE